MSDPRYDWRPDSGGVWGWIAGIVVLFLIAVIVIAGANHNKNTASNGPAATTGSATAPIKSPSTTTGMAPSSTSPAK